MKNRTHKLLIVTLSVLVLLLGGCKKVKDIRVTSFELESVAPQGLTGLNAEFAVGISNPAMQVKLEDVEAVLKRSGKVLGRMTVDPFVIEARTDAEYRLKGYLRLGEDANLRDLLQLLDASVLDQYTVDVTANARHKSGVAAPIAVNDIPLKKLLEKAGYEKN